MSDDQTVDGPDCFLGRLTFYNQADAALGIQHYGSGWRYNRFPASWTDTANSLEILGSCAADALFVHLNDYPAFLRVLPSKLFEYGATSLPILAGVGGVAADLVAAELPDAILFPPLDCDAMVVGTETLMKRRDASDSARPDRAGFIDKYLRPRISAQLAAAIRATRNGKRQ